jgi:hypothetical protein
VHYVRYTLGIWAGYKHRIESIALPGEPPPYHIVDEILRPIEPQSEKPVRQHDRRCVAKSADYLWHTDLHEIVIPDEQTGGLRTIYLIAFLDDASRYIMHHPLIADRKTETCAAVLSEAPQLWAGHSLLF